MAKLLVVCRCGHKMQAPASALGETRTCGKCGKRLRISGKNTSVLEGTGLENGPALSQSAVRTKKRIGELLIEEGLISEGQLAEGLAVQNRRGGKLVEILISLGYIDARTFVNFLARQPGIASIDLHNYEIPDDLITVVPREFAVKHEVFPIDKLGNLLTLGMACPLDHGALNELEDLTGLRVKPVLCAAQDIQAAINRYYPVDKQDRVKVPAEPAAKDIEELETALKLKSVAAMIRQIESLPALPGTVQRVQEVMHDPRRAASDVARVVATDPAVAAKVLAVANSAAYGFPNRVDAVDLAVVLLGLREVYSIVLSVAVVDLFTDSKCFDYQVFWQESLSCATAAKLVANASQRKHLTGVFAAGLLHDIGRIALSQAAPERYARVNQVLMGDELLAAEEEELGLIHTEAGYELAKRWGLPNDIAQAIRFHHHPELASEANEVVAVVALADAVIRAGEPGSAETDALFDGCADVLGLLRLDRSAVTGMLFQYRAISREELPSF